MGKCGFALLLATLAVTSVFGVTYHRSFRHGYPSGAQGVTVRTSPQPAALKAPAAKGGGAFRAREELWSTSWTEVNGKNGVWDDCYRQTKDPANCSFKFRVMRHVDAIGVEAFVRDDRVVVDNCPANSISCETWKDDCLEVFFDGDNDRNPNTRGTDEAHPLACNAGGEYAMAANGSSQSDYASAKRCFGTLWGGTAEPWTKGDVRRGTHYRLWFKYACLGRPTPRLDEPVRFGFTICVHDDDDGGANDLALYWKGNPKIPYADESAFGTITLPAVGVR